MNPPERIYLQTDPEGEGSMGHEGVTWCSDKINETDIEYVRADLTMEAQIKARMPAKINFNHKKKDDT